MTFAGENARSHSDAVFVDKDGTLIEDVPYNVDPDLIRLVPGAAESLRRLQRLGFKIAVVSNQSGVARGLFAERELGDVENRLRQLLSEGEVHLDGWYYCPHHPEGIVREYAIQCECRKPAPGLLLRATEELGIDLSGSWMIGDILNDVEAGIRAGCKTILLDNGNETEWVGGPRRVPDFVARDWAEVARIIEREQSGDVNADGIHTMLWPAKRGM
ncbi:MAG: D-glycero-alpha-D-manno-heptose-1,7-bisphosphate 7-phosphatase [Rudaea sp.]